MNFKQIHNIFELNSLVQCASIYLLHIYLGRRRKRKRHALEYLENVSVSGASWFDSVMKDTRKLIIPSSGADQKMYVVSMVAAKTKAI